MQLWVVMVLLILLGLPPRRKYLYRCIECSNGTFNFTWTASTYICAYKSNTFGSNGTFNFTWTASRREFKVRADVLN